MNIDAEHGSWVVTVVGQIRLGVEQRARVGVAAAAQLLQGVAARGRGRQRNMTRGNGVQASEQEVRYWPTHLEARSEGAIRRIGGLGVPYNKRSRLLPGGFFEVVEPRAMAKTLGDKLNVVSRMEHHPEWLLATTDSGTLRITGEARGLSYEADLPDTTAGRDCYELVRTGRMPYSSVGFQAFKDEFRRDGSALVRHLVSIRLSEVSPVSQPAYSTRQPPFARWRARWAKTPKTLRHLRSGASCAHCSHVRISRLRHRPRCHRA